VNKTWKDYKDILETTNQKNKPTTKKSSDTIPKEKEKQE